jgi:glucosamine 6-phosphate synthetase-like amidotransferase/phosphosugar isomerase protein
MCGIFGVVSCQPWTPEEWALAEASLERLFIASERRGRDAAGYACVAQDGVLRYLKQPGPAERFLQQGWAQSREQLRTLRPTVFVGHTRAGTKGSAQDNINNHPLVDTDAGIAVVHNGVISNDDEVFKKERLERDGQVDSEVLLRLIAKRTEGPKLKHLARGVVGAYKRLRGNAAIAVVKRGYPKSLLLAADGNPITLAYVPKLHSIWFASTQDILKDGLAQTEWVYGYFKTRTELPDGLFRKQEDETLVWITAEGAEDFTMGQRACTLDPTAYYYGREAGDEPEWPTSRQSPRGGEGGPIGFCEAPEGDVPRTPITVTEFLEKQRAMERQRELFS